MKHGPGCSRSFRWGVAAAVLAGVSSPAVARAAQLVLVDVTYTHGPATTKDSHYHVKPPATAPKNWRSPVDYASGRAYLHLEVRTKPSTAGTKFQVCFSGSPSYACTAQSPTYTTTGVVTWTSPFSGFYQYNRVDWTKGISNISLILKDTNNGKPAPENVGATRAAMYMPTDLRVVVTLVPPGETYTPPTSTMARDGGAGDAAGEGDEGAGDGGVDGVDATEAADARAAGGAGGTTSGSGGMGAGGAGGMAAGGGAGGQGGSSVRRDARAAPEEDDDEDLDPPAPRASGGCAVAGTGRPGLVTALAGLLAAVTARRRRRR